MIQVSGVASPAIADDTDFLLHFTRLLVFQIAKTTVSPSITTKLDAALSWIAAFP
jgi:hypothetical protein